MQILNSVNFPDFQPPDICTTARTLITWYNDVFKENHNAPTEDCRGDVRVLAGQIQALSNATDPSELFKLYQGLAFLIINIDKFALGLGEDENKDDGIFGTTPSSLEKSTTEFSQL